MPCESNVATQLKQQFSDLPPHERHLVSYFCSMHLDASAIAHEIRMIRKIAQLFEQLGKHGIKLSAKETKDAIAKIRSGTTPSTVESQLRESKKSASARKAKPKPGVG